MSDLQERTNALHKKLKQHVKAGERAAWELEQLEKQCRDDFGIGLGEIAKALHAMQKKHEQDERELERVVDEYERELESLEGDAGAP